MKTVAAAVGGSLAASNLVLTGPSEPQTRWGLGSLMASILAMSAVPLIMVLRSSGQSSMFLGASEAGIEGLTAVELDDVVPTFRLSRGEGTSKSRPVSVEFPATTVSPSEVVIDSNPADLENPVHAALVPLVSNPPEPSFTLLGVINKLEAFLDAQAPGWYLIVDQASEKIWFFDAAADFTPQPSMPVILDSVGDLYAFNLTLDETTETVPGYGWE